MGENDVRFNFEVSGYESKFRVVKFSGAESISQLFRYEIYVGTDDDNVPIEDIIHRPAVLWISRGDDTRFVSGMVSRFWWLGERDSYSAYYIELVPAVWLLTQRYDCRIFQDLAVPDIIEAVLKDARLQTDLYDLSQVQAEGKHKVREYCVQYHESDFDFISRLMEEEGIFYYFTHHFESQKRHWKHVLVLGNNPSRHPQIDRSEKDKSPKEAVKVDFKETSGLVPEEEYVYECRAGHQIRTEAVMLRDFNYLHPNTKLSEREAVKEKDYLEYYTYPGGFEKEDEGKKLAKIRLEEERAQYELISGRSNCCRFIPGFYFTLDKHPKKKYNQKYLLLSMIQAGQQREVKADENLEGFDKIINLILEHAPLPSIGPFSPQQIYTNLKKIADELFGTDEKFVYSNQFTCIPLGTPFRPPRITPKPLIHGPQTARVMAPDKNKPQVDDLGRVRVKFHWDREDKDDFKRTCDIRMAYSYAGEKHGIQFPPLHDDEVVVSFLEGDPDKPLITGVVYNGSKLPPLKPADMLANVVLTPYQHRLLFSDRDASITLNTGGHDGRCEVIEMIDGDSASEFGQQIKITTADDHHMHLCKGSRASGIQIQTQLGHKMIFVDDPHPDGIKIQDKDQVLSLDMNSDSKIIVIRNQSGPEIRVECGNGKVTIQGGGVEVVGGQVNINGSGSVAIKSAGQIKLEAPAIEATAAGSIKLAAPDITLEGATINLNAPMVAALNLLQAKGLVQTPTLIAGSVVATSYTPGAGNIM